MASGIFISCNNDKNAKQTNTKSTTEDTVKNSGKPEETNGNRETTTNSTEITNGDNSRGWTSDSENLYMYECIREAEKNTNKTIATKYCECTLEKVKANYSSYNEANTKLTLNQNLMQEIANDCKPTYGQ